MPPIIPKKELSERVTLGKYRHFKGNEYEVIGFATHTENGERLVIYRNIANPEEVWARPYTMFQETVWHNGQQQKRFEKLS